MDTQETPQNGNGLVLKYTKTTIQHPNQTSYSLQTKAKMITVKVTYTVNDNYVNDNKKMIQAFLADFKKLDNSQFLYTILQSEDGKTFTHISQYQNKDIQQVLLNTPSFCHFQEQRDKNLASEPKIEVLNYIGASKEIF